MTRPVFATPSLNWTVSLEYLRSWTETHWALANRGIQSGVLTRGGDCFVAKVRNKMVTEFLRNFPSATDLFFLDDDIGWPAAKVVEFLDRPEAVLAGVYPKKSEMTDFPVELAANDRTGELIERDGLVRANAAPTGFMRIKRHVLETLADTAQRFVDLELDGSTPDHYGIFESGIGTNGWWWGEDYTFCQKWTGAGGEIWIDPSIAFTHRGQRKWEATLSDHLDAFRERGRQAVAKLNATPPLEIDINEGKLEAA